MSVPPKGEELPKKGEESPLARTRQEQAREFAQAIAGALKEELARGASIKTIMAWTGAGERTVKEWLAGSNAPRAFQVECLMRSSDLVYERLIIRTGRKPVVNREDLKALKAHLTGLVGAIDTALG